MKARERSIKTPPVNFSIKYNETYWRSIFDKYDKDGNGRISYRELKGMLQDSPTTSNIPDRVVRLIMQKADLDESGYLDYSEFVTMIHRKDMKGVFGHFLDRYVNCFVPKSDIKKQPPTYEGEYSCTPPALAMITMSFIEILLYLYDAVTIAPDPEKISPPAFTLFMFDPRRRGEAWRFITYMFIHADLLHLSGNVVMQIIFGVPLEMVHRWSRVLVIYFAGVLAGSLATSIFDPNIDGLVGASAGVYALLIAHLATLIMNWSEMKNAVLQLVLLILYIGFDIGVPLYKAVKFPDREDNVGYIAHLFGGITGLLIGINVLRNLKVEKWERCLWWICLFTYVAMMAAAILWNVCNPDYFPQLEESSAKMSE